jgi:hypothetical protein
MSTTITYEPAINAAKYNLMLENSLNGQLGKEEYLNYTLLSFYYRTAFDFAKNNMLNVSNYYFDQGDLLLKHISSETLYIWLSLYSLPKKAYLLYKKRKINQAELMTLKVIDVCQYLRSKGDNYLIFAELQQYQNLSRIYFFSGKVEQAIQLNLQCFQLLYCGSSELTTSHYLTVDDDVKNELSTALTYQLFIDSLSTLKKVAKDDKYLISAWLKLLLTDALIGQMEEKELSPEFTQLLTGLKLLKLIPLEEWAGFTNGLSEYLDDNVLMNVQIREILLSYLTLFS